jgi:hypothetical protein
MAKSRRWLLAAAVFLLVLAACTNTAGRPGPGTGTAGTPAGSGSAAPGGLRAVRHDGFTFFASVTANQAFCAAHILSFRPLPGDLTRAGATPAFSWISPNLCDDGHDAPCVTGAPGGLAQADAFLAQWCRTSWPRRPTVTAA